MLLALAYFKKGRDVHVTLMNKNVLIPAIFAGLFGYYLATLLDFYSLQLIAAGVSRVIISLFPIFVLILNSIYKKSLPDLKTVILFLMAFIGVFMLLGGYNLNIVKINLIGVLLALLATFSYSLYVIINGEVVKRIGSVLFTCYAVLFSFLLINLHYWLANNQSAIMEISSKGWLIILTMSFFCTFLPLLLISEAIARLGLLRFSLINNLGPIFAVVISYFTLGEKMILQQVLGVAMIVIVLFISKK